MARDEREEVQIETRAAWRAWLEANHTQTESIWLISFKKSAGDRYLPYDHVVEEALCFGWIDGQTRSVDDERSAQLLSPRRAGSMWSASNKRRLVELEAAGLMRPAGRAVVERAKADGSWTLLDDVEALVVPDDLRAALDATAGANEGWAALPDGAKKQHLWWIKSAKRAPTRAKRIAATAAAMGRGERAVE